MPRQVSATQIVVGAATTALAALMIFVMSWLWQNLVFAADLDAAIEKSIRPVVAQVSANSTLITTSIRNGLRADIRDLRKEIQDMNAQKEDRPDTWSPVHEALLEEWVEEQEQLEDQLDELNND